MKEIGDILKAARERQGLTIEDVAERTKIHRYKLEAIEAGQQEMMPAKVFAIGLIKSYARELKVDSETIDELCKQAFSEPEEPQVDPGEALATGEPGASIQATEKSQTASPDTLAETQPLGLFQVPKVVALLISFSFIFVLSLSIYFIAQKMNSYSEEEAQASGIMEFEPTETEPPRAKPDTTPDEIKPEPMSVKKPTEPSKKIKKETQQVEAAQGSVQLPEKTDTTELGPEVGEEPQGAENNPEPVSSGLSDQKLNIRALEPVRIEIIWSDGYNQGLMLKRDESKTLVFSSPIKVRVDNGGAIEVRFNDKNQGVPGPLNKAIELKFP